LKREYQKLVDALREKRPIDEIVEFPDMSSYWNHNSDSDLTLHLSSMLKAKMNPETSQDLSKSLEVSKGSEIEIANLEQAALLLQKELDFKE